MKNKTIILHIVLAVLTAIAIVPAIVRDLQLESAYPSDLRNRQVGARLIIDGKLPYYYHYTGEQGLRYYDPKNCTNLKVANITATPVLHQLFAPVCDLPFANFSMLWLVASYAIWLIIYILFQALSKDTASHIIAWLISISFLYTEAWKTHIYEGQYYLLMPLLWIGLYWLQQQKQKLSVVISIGIVATLLILIRPIAAFFFLPFIFLLPQYKRQAYCIAICFIIACTTIYLLPFQNSLWQQYSSSISDHIINHQTTNAVLQNNLPCPTVTNLEGFDLVKAQANETIFIYTESGNIHLLWETIFKQRMPLQLLYILSYSCMAIMLLAYYLKHKKYKTYNIINACLLGICLTMLIDLCAPVNRMQYNTVQWIFPLLLLSQVRFSTKNYAWLFVIAIGWILNMANIDAIKMEHSIGEYMMLLGFFALSLSPSIKPKNQSKLAVVAE